MTILTGLQPLIRLLIWIAAALVYSLGIVYTLGRWGLAKKKQWMTAGFFCIYFALFWLIRPLPLALIAAVLVTGLSLPSPWHKLRFLDGLGLWMPVGLAVLLMQSDGTGGFWVILAQLLLLAGFILLRQVYGVRFYARFGQMYFLSLSLCGIALLIAFPDWLHAVLLAAGILGFGIISLKKPKEEKPLLLFDLDGTLIDSQQLVFETFKRVFAKKKPGYPLSQKELYSFFGPTLEVTFSKYFPPDEVPEVIDLYQVINKELHPKYLKEMPHAKESMQALKEQGYRMAIVSNKRRDPVLYGMELTGLTPYFEKVFAKEDQPRPKPAPDGLIHAANAMGVPLDNVIYVGDNAADIQAARNAALFSAGYTLDRTQFSALQNENPCCILNDLRQLNPILKEEKLWIDKSIW